MNKTLAASAVNSPRAGAADVRAILKRAAWATRSEVYALPPDSPKRDVLMGHARELEALALNLDIVIAADDRLNVMMRRAIELALFQVDEQAGAGIDVAHQQINYTGIFTQVRGEMAAKEEP